MTGLWELMREARDNLGLSLDQEQEQELVRMFGLAKAEGVEAGIVEERARWEE